MSYNEKDFTKGELAMPSKDERVLATLLYVSSFFTVDWTTYHLAAQKG